MIINKKNTLPRSQADVAWKDILEEFFQEAIEFSFPTLHTKIDWKRPWCFLDKELQAITRGNKEGARFVDKLIRVHLLDGQEKWLLIHIEIQGTPENDFPKRMFIYHYRIFDKFSQHPVSCAILSDNCKSWSPDRYEHNQLDCELSFKFPILKLLDLEKSRDILEKSKNPFACIVLAQLNTLKLRNYSTEKRYQIKLSEIKKLYSKDFNGSTIRKLYHFIDALIGLPADLELKFKDDIFKFEETNHMRYVSTIEQMGIEKGMQQGMQEGIHQGMQQGMQQRTQEIALRMFQKGQPIELIADITGLSKAELLILLQNNNQSVVA